MGSMTQDQISVLSVHLHKGSYEICNGNRADISAGMEPIGIPEFSFSDPYFGEILDDDQGFYTVLHMRITYPQHAPFEIPVGMYGTSPKNKTRFPLIIGGLVLSLIATDFNSVEKIIGGTPGKAAEHTFQKIKVTLIDKIISFLAKLNDGYETGMAWSLRESDNFVRSVIESNSLYCHFDDPATKVQFYYTNNSGTSFLEYFQKCAKRWGQAKRKHENDVIEKPVLTDDVKNNEPVRKAQLLKELFSNITVDNSVFN